MFQKKLNLRSVFAGVICLAVTTMVSGCEKKGDPDNPSNGDGFKVQFVANGGVTAPIDQTVEKGGKVVEPSAMSNPNHEDFNGWYTSADFEGSPYDFNSAVTSDLKLYAKWGYKVGDTGPAGGKVFYVKSGATYPDWKYLEVAPVEQAFKNWATGAYDDNSNPNDADLPVSHFAIEGAMGVAIGTGKSNTAAIIAAKSTLPRPAVEPDAADFPPAVYCVGYNGGGKSDWFMPSKEELNELWKNREVAGCNTSEWSKRYWTSSQCDDPNRNDNVWGQEFGTSEFYQSEFAKENQPVPYNVRPVRQFFCNH